MAEGYDGGQQGVGGVNRDVTPASSDVLTSQMFWRHVAGYGAALASVVGIGTLLWHAFDHLIDSTGYDHLVRVNSEASLHVLIYESVRLAAFAAVTIAGVYFFYQVLKAAERLVLPGHLARQPATMRLLLGIEDPIRASKRVLNAVGDLAGELVSKLPPNKKD